MALDSFAPISLANALTSSIEKEPDSPIHYRLCFSVSLFSEMIYGLVTYCVNGDRVNEGSENKSEIPRDAKVMNEIAFW